MDSSWQHETSWTSQTQPQSGRPPEATGTAVAVTTAAQHREPEPGGPCVSVGQPRPRPALHTGEGGGRRGGEERRGGGLGSPRETRLSGAQPQKHRSDATLHCGDRASNTSSHQDTHDICLLIRFIQNETK